MKRKRASRSLMAFWIIGFGILGFRGCYDLKLYLQGGTVVVRTGVQGYYDYLLHFPQGYHDDSGPRPLILFLHGAGEIGRDVSRIKGHDPFYHANGIVDAESFPFLVVAPASPENRWDPEEVVAFLDELLAERRFRFQIDPNRIYLTGHSMGGFGTFEIACRYPERFAAIVPVAGGCHPDQAAKLLSVPVWAFHGDADPVVQLNQTEGIMEELQRLHHHDARFTILHGWEHGINQPVYSHPYLYRWLLNHNITCNRQFKN